MPRSLIIYLLLAVLLSCKLSVVQRDEVDYSDMVAEGISLIESREDSPNLVIKLIDGSIVSNEIENPSIHGTSWHFIERLTIAHSEYNSYISNSSKDVLLVKLY